MTRTTLSRWWVFLCGALVPAGLPACSANPTDESVVAASGLAATGASLAVVDKYLSDSMPAWGAVEWQGSKEAAFGPGSAGALLGFTRGRLTITTARRSSLFVLSAFDARGEVFRYALRLPRLDGAQVARFEILRTKSALSAQEVAEVQALFPRSKAIHALGGVLPNNSDALAEMTKEISRSIQPSLTLGTLSSRAETCESARSDCGGSYWTYVGGQGAVGGAALGTIGAVIGTAVAPGPGTGLAPPSEPCWAESSAPSRAPSLPATRSSRANSSTVALGTLGPTKRRLFPAGPLSTADFSAKPARTGKPLNSWEISALRIGNADRTL